MKGEQKTKHQKIEHIKKITKVSSASLAANNYYTLDETVLDMVLQKHTAEEAALVAAQARKDAAEAKRAEVLKNALQKFVFCPNSLTVPDMRALVIASSNASDSPAKKKKDDIQEQLYREPRYARVQALANDFRLTLTSATNSAAAEALISLHTIVPPSVTNTTPV